MSATKLLIAVHTLLQEAHEVQSLALARKMQCIAQSKQYEQNLRADVSPRTYEERLMDVKKWQK